MPPAGNGLGSQSTASGYASIYSFGERGKADDGANPFASLVSFRGAFYGTTEYGGTTNSQCSLGCGTVYRVTADGAESVVYKFKGGADGANPAAGLIAFKGSFFGTTSAGGAASGCGGGCGTVFKLSPDGKSESILHAFTGAADGAAPVAGVVRMGSAFYGTTQLGGTVTQLCTSGCGTVYKIGESGNESIVYRFKGRADGAYPTGGLLALEDDLYGTTQYGGAATRFCANGCGTLFKVTGAGAKTALHAFKYGRIADGAYPAASLVAIGGELYGTTAGGGKYGDGAVFRASASTGAEKLMHSFRCCDVAKDGAYPVAPLVVVNRELYGTTRDGGNGNAGTVFVVTASGVESLLYEFTSKPDGLAPQAELILSGGRLYGTTAYGGSASLGTVFKLPP
jgi:uncharacterized repeat protein (TIGR03803 family)